MARRARAAGVHSGQGGVHGSGGRGAVAGVPSQHGRLCVAVAGVPVSTAGCALPWPESPVSTAGCAFLECRERRAGRPLWLGLCYQPERELDGGQRGPAA